MEKTLDTFMKYQVEAEERFQKREDERWKEEMEIEENRRKEDQQHEMRMMQMIGQMMQRRSYPPPTSAYEFNYDDTF